MSKDISGIVAWLKNWFYDKTEINGFITTLNNSINSKLNKNLTEANKQLVTDGSGQVVLANKPTVPINTSDLVNDGASGVDTYVEMGDLSNVATSGSYNDLSNKPTIPDVSNLIDTAGTGLSKTGTTLNHSNSVTAQSSAVFKKITYDGQGHITGTADVGEYDLPIHSHGAIKVYDNDYVAYTHINPLDRHQSSINSAIDTAIGDLQSIKAIEVVSSLPTASADTMGKLYIISENSKINVYYTTVNKVESTYDWHKMDADILDDLSIEWSEIENNPFSSSTPSSFANASHTHGEITNDGKIGNSANKVIMTGTGGTLTAVTTIGATTVADVNAYSNIGSSAGASQRMINSAIDTAIGNVKSGRVTSIALVPYSEDQTGAIRLYYGDEPSS